MTHVSPYVSSLAAALAFGRAAWLGCAQATGPDLWTPGREGFRFARAARGDSVSDWCEAGWRVPISITLRLRTPERREGLEVWQLIIT